MIHTSARSSSTSASSWLSVRFHSSIRPSFLHLQQTPHTPTERHRCCRCAAAPLPPPPHFCVHTPAQRSRSCAGATAKWSRTLTPLSTTSQTAPSCASRAALLPTSSCQWTNKLTCQMHTLVVCRVVGGFGLCGIPENTIQALVKQVRALACVCLFIHNKGCGGSLLDYRDVGSERPHVRLQQRGRGRLWARPLAPNAASEAHGLVVRGRERAL